MAIELQSQKKEEKSRKGKSFSTPLFGTGRITAHERMFFTERLALLLETGNSIHPSLESLKEQTDNAALAAIIEDLDNEVVSGKSFSQALAKHPEMFSSTYVNLISAGEQGGFMHTVLNELQAMEKKQDELRSTISSAFSYPAFLAVFSVLVVVFILVAVFPKFATLFESIKDQLPITTIFLMAASEIIGQFWHLILIGIVGFVYGVIKFLFSAGGRMFTDRLKLSIPGLRSIFIQIYLVQFLRVMSLSLANGVSVMDALHSCLDVIDNTIFRKFVKTLEEKVGEGQGISVGFEESELMPSMVRQTIRTGEQSGNLAMVMEKIADYYERELQRRIAALSKIAEPVMLMIMGVVVGLIVSSLILPIFKLGSAVQ